jgi:ribosomal protein S18 acetylase RimI-like enzyme
MSQAKVEARVAETSDATGIASVARTTWAETYAGIIPDAVQHRLLEAWYSVPGLARAMAALGVFLVAEQTRAVVAFAQFVRRTSESVELTRIYVLPEHQHEGIGTQLLEAGLAACREHGASHVTVFVERDNTAGRRFYRRRGFAELRERRQEIEGHVLELVECHRPL